MSGCAIVTGASRNIGAAIACRLASDGYPVVVNYAGDGDPASVVDRIRSGGGRALAVEADIADQKAVESMIAEAIGLYGSIASLVNNASTAVARRVPWTEDSADDWDRILRVNVTGAFLCAKAAAEHMSPGCSIVNVSSITPLIGFSRNLPYVASKAAVIGMTHSLASELGPRGIRVNAVLPGAISTPQQREVFGDAPPEDLPKQALDVGGTPEDVAAAVAFLASNDAGFITGQCLVVDGGATFH